MCAASHVRSCVVVLFEGFIPWQSVSVACFPRIQSAYALFLFEIRDVPNNNHPFNTKPVADRCLELCRDTSASLSEIRHKRRTRALSTGTLTWASNGRWRLRSRRVERGCALPDTVRTSCAVLVRYAPCPCLPSAQACATGEKLKCAQLQPQEADPLQVCGIPPATATIYLSTLDSISNLSTWLSYTSRLI